MKNPDFKQFFGEDVTYCASCSECNCIEYQESNDEDDLAATLIEDGWIATDDGLLCPEHAKESE